MNLLILTGEISGDLYGATLARSLQKQDPTLNIEAIGGPALRDVCTRLIYETAHGHSVGIAGIFQSINRIHQLKQAIYVAYQKKPWDAVILVDFQHYNFKLAAFFKTLNVPVITFITPNFWIWKSVPNAKKVAAYSHSIFTIFEKEYAFYTPLHPRVYYCGHPLVDCVNQDKKRSNPLPTRTRNGLKTLTLMPGSRQQEIDMLLPKMAQTARYLGKYYPQLEINLAISSPQFTTLIDEILGDFPDLKIKKWTTQKPELFGLTDFMLCASGSVTLEALLYHVPIGVLCALPRLTFWVAKFILRLKMKWISLPNIIGGRRIVPEWVQSDIQPHKMAIEIRDLWTQDPKALWTANYRSVIRSMTPTASPTDSIAQTLLSVGFLDSNRVLSKN